MWSWSYYEADMFVKYSREEKLRRIEQAQLIHPRKRTRRKRSRPSMLLTLKTLLSRFTLGQVDQPPQRSLVTAGSVTGTPRLQECC